MTSTDVVPVAAAGAVGAAQLPVCGAADGLWGGNGPPPKKLCDWGHSGGFGEVHKFEPMSPGGPGTGGRPRKPGAAPPGGPHGDETDPRGLVVPQPGPTTPVARRPAGVATTSSSSDIRADGP